MADNREKWIFRGPVICYGNDKIFTPMKKYLYLVAAILFLLAAIGWQAAQLRKVKADRNIYRRNTETLLADAERYRTRDSLSAISVRSLELKISEFERYRAEDAALIRTLSADRQRLEQVTTTQLQTIYNLQGQVRDSIVYRDNRITDTLRCIDIADTWFDLHGCTDSSGAFSGTFESRDSLLYVEYVIPKRFLGFLWKTKRIKERRQEIVSRNPHTVITSAEFVTIRK